jgi:hypothetical protein
MKSQKKVPKKRAPRKGKARPRAETEDALDAALMDSFPASDPVSMTEPAPDHERDAERKGEEDEQHAPGP